MLGAASEQTPEKGDQVSGSSVGEDFTHRLELLSDPIQALSKTDFPQADKDLISNLYNHKEVDQLRGMAEDQKRMADWAGRENAPNKINFNNRIETLELLVQALEHENKN